MKNKSILGCLSLQRRRRISEEDILLRFLQVEQSLQEDIRRLEKENEALRRRINEIGSRVIPDWNTE